MDESGGPGGQPHRPRSCCEEDWQPQEERSGPCADSHDRDPPAEHRGKAHEDQHGFALHPPDGHAVQRWCVKVACPRSSASSGYDHDHGGCQRRDGQEDRTGRAVHDSKDRDAPAQCRSKYCEDQEVRAHRTTPWRECSPMTAHCRSPCPKNQYLPLFP